MSETKKIGDKISLARKKKNLSQSQLAENMHISAQAVGKWERGESMPDIISFARLAELLDVDLNYFSENYQSIITKPDSNESNHEAEKIIAPTSKTRAGWNMSRGNWVDGNFSGLKNLHEKFSSSNMQRCKFNDSDLSGMILENNNVTGCDFTHANLKGSEIRNSYLMKNLFVGSSMIDVEFRNSFLSDADLTESDLSGLRFVSGGFEKITATGVIWNQTTFLKTYLCDIDFEGNISDCSFEECYFKRVKFKNAVLRNSFFKNRKLKGIEFENCKADRLTYEFLKNGKANMDGISLLDEN